VKVIDRKLPSLRGHAIIYGHKIFMKQAPGGDLLKKNNKINWWEERKRQLGDKRCCLNHFVLLEKIIIAK